MNTSNTFCISYFYLCRFLELSNPLSWWQVQTHRCKSNRLREQWLCYIVKYNQKHKVNWFYQVTKFILSKFKSSEGNSPAQHETNRISDTDGASHHSQFLEEQSQAHKMSSSHPIRTSQSWQCWAEQHSLQLTLTWKKGPKTRHIQLLINILSIKNFLDSS